MNDSPFIKFSAYIFATAVVLLALLFLSAGVLPCASQRVAGDEPELTSFSQSNLPAKGNPKLDSALNQLLSQASRRIGELNDSRMSLLSGETNVRVIVESEPGTAGILASAIGSLGVIEGSYGNLLQVNVPVSSLSALAETPGVRFVRKPMIPLPAVISEGIPLINADDWQAVGYNGTGVKIAILDIGFGGYTARQSQGELPASLTTQSFYDGGNIEGPSGNPQSHGTACAEIVYDIAPAATYYLVNFGTGVEFGQAVDWLIDQDIDVISCSVGWPAGGPGDGTGFFCQVIDSAKAAGITWAQAAGNMAQKHWAGTWNNPDSDFWLNFSGDDEGNTITASAGQIIVAALTWDDPWYASANDYDLLLYNNSTGNLTAYSLNIQDGDDDPYEVLAYEVTSSGSYDIAIGTTGSPAPVNFHLFSFYQDLQYRTATNSLVVPADSFSSITAGAVNYATPTTLESFSSQGPTDDGRIKPDLVAPDGVSTATYGTNNFYGTSAAAPHTAGAAALVKQRYPTNTPSQIQAFLEGRAVDLGSGGKDNLYGSGRLDLGDPTNHYTLTMTVSGSGSVTPPAGKHSYLEGTVVDISAQPASGWQFFKWAGDVANPNSPNTTITIDADKVVTAYFNSVSNNWSMYSDLNNLVCVADGDQAGVQITTDGAGGAIIVWQDNRSGNWDIYAQRIESSGNALWTENGVSICSAAGDQSNPHITSDGMGGAIITWIDGRDHVPDFPDEIQYEVYTQRVDSSGNSLWTPNGVVISIQASQDSQAQVISDGASGAFISWDSDNDTDDVRVQRIDASGNILWPAEGVIAGGGYIIANEQQLVSDGSDGVIVTWVDYRNAAANIYVQRIDAPGTVRWTSGGVALYVDNGYQYCPQIISDGVGGAIITWFDDYDPNSQYIYAQRLNPSGDLLWNSRGVKIHNQKAFRNFYSPQITLDGSGGAIITWLDFHLGFGNINIFAQRINPSGNVVWAADGVVIRAAGDDQHEDKIMSIISDGSGGAIITWGNDDRDNNVYAQRVSSTGSTLWTSNGVAVCTAAGSQNAPMMVSDGSGGAIITWSDSRNGNWDIYVQRVDQNATLGIQHGSILTMAVNGSGTTTPSIGDHHYPVGSVVNVSATSSTGWEFVNWTGDVANPNSPDTTVTMDTDKTVTANFQRTTSVLEINIVGSGTTDPSAGIYTYPIGSNVTLTASAATNWAFHQWTGDVSDNASPSTTVTLDTDKTVTAHFIRTNGVLNISAVGSGSITPLAGTYTYPVGSSVNITATPASGWRFVNWTGDVSTIADVNSANTSVTINSDYSIVANFSNTVTLAIAQIGSGSITPSAGSHTYSLGASVNITAQAASSWHFVKWTGDVSTVADINVSSTNVTMDWDKTITANFAVNQSGGGGGGGGGGSSGGINGKIITSLRGAISATGEVYEDIQAQSIDLMVQLDLPYGVKALNANGYPLTSISITQLATPDEPSDNMDMIGKEYEFGPNGANFDPPLKFTIRYKETDLEEGTAENILTIGTWDTETSTFIPIDCQLNTENNQLTASISHFSRYAIVAIPKPARFSLSDMKITPQQVKPGEKVTVSIAVTNTGSLSGNYTCTLNVNNSVIETKKVLIAGGQTTTLTFNFLPEDPGTSDVNIGDLSGQFSVAASPAEFEVNALTVSPEAVDIGEKAEVTVTVMNKGQSSGTYELHLDINGMDIATKEVNLEGGDSQQVIFNITQDTAGKKLIDVDGLVASLIVNGETAPPEPIPLPAEENTWEDVLTVEPGATPATQSQESPQDSGTKWVILYSVVGGLAAVILVSYFFWRRKRVKNRPNEPPA